MSHAICLRHAAETPIIDAAATSRRQPMSRRRAPIIYAAAEPPMPPMLPSATPMPSADAAADAARR